MAKLIDKLHQLGRPEPTPIGFGRSTSAARGAAMLLIGEVAAKAAKKAASGKAGETVDALLIDGVPDEASVKALAGKIWGVRLREASADTLDALGEGGCDFILVGSDEAPALMLRNDGMARGFPITEDLSEEQARALDELPFDYLTLDFGSAPSELSLARLMKLQTAVSMVGKHILLRSSACPSPTELELLRDMPIDAVVLDIAAVGAAGLAEAKKTLDELEPRKPKGHRDSPLIPQAITPGVEETAQEDQDWDDEPDELRWRT